MARLDRPADPEVVARMRALIQAALVNLDRIKSSEPAVSDYVQFIRGSLQAADKIGAEAARMQQDGVLRRASNADTDPAAATTVRRRRSGADLFRQRLFDQASPARILGFVNALDVYLGEHPAWDSWGWTETHDINTRMFPLVRELFPNDPLPDDSRLALPFTLASCALSRALHLSPDAELTANVYRLVGETIVALNRLVGPEGLEADYDDAREHAAFLLLHGARFGLEAWDLKLINQCGLQDKCLHGQPFFISPPGARRYHDRCRKAVERRRPHVTTKSAKRKR